MTKDAQMPLPPDGFANQLSDGSQRMTRQAWGLVQIACAVIVLVFEALGLLAFHPQRFPDIHDSTFTATLARFDQTATLLLLSTLPIAGFMVIAGVRVLHDRDRWHEPMPRMPLYAAVLMAYVVLFAVCAVWIAAWLM